MIKNMDNKKKLTILISGIVVLVALIVLGIATDIDSSKKDFSNTGNLGDVQYTCSDWVVGSWSSWTAGAPSDGNASDPSSSCTTTTSYTQIEVKTTLTDCQAVNINSVPCYRQRIYTRTRTISQCNDGYYLVSGTCYICPTGYYCNGTSKTACPTGTTSDAGADSEDDCYETTVTSCDLGEYLSGGICYQCPIGYYCQGVDKVACTGSSYQDETGQASCKFAPSNSTVNSTHTSYTCNSGYVESNGACILDTSSSYSISCPSSLYVGETGSCSISGGSLTGSVTSSSSSVASVSSTGTSSFSIKGVSAGSATFTATIDGQSVTSNSVTIEETTVSVTSVSVICSSSSLTVGSNTSCTATVLPSDATSKSVTWSSSDSSIAGVDQSGYVTAKSAGTVRITAKSTSDSSISDSYLIIVSSEVQSCSAGYFMGESTCEKCPGGYYCEDGNVKTVCPDGKTSDAGATSASECYEKADDSECTVSVSIDSSSTSIDKDNINNSYYAVRVTVSGKGCSGQTLDYSATNASSLSRSSQTNISSGMTYYFNVYPANACTSSTATATLRATGSSDSATVSTILTDWEIENGCWTSAQASGKPIGFVEADSLGANEYFDDYGLCPGTTNTYGYTTHAYRYGCGSPAPTPTYACYVNSSTGDYKWATTSPGSGYVISTTITTEGACVPPVIEPQYCYIKLGNGSSNSYCYGTSSMCAGYTQKVENVSSAAYCSETPACYQSPSGEYVTGRYSGQSGYVYIGTSCPAKPVEPQYCYIKIGSGTPNTYCFGTSSMCAGYTQKIDDVNNYTACSETPACYKTSSGAYVTGNYSGQSGYTYIGTSCPANPNSACYTDSTGTKFSWSTASPGNGWSIVSGKTEDTCKACFVNSSTNDYKWSTSSPGEGYVISNKITTAGECISPPPTPEEKPACYKHKNGEYVWGTYASDNSYTLVPNVSSADECKEVIDVPKTDANVMAIIYIFVIILLGSGSYFIYYVYNKKRLSK